MSKILLVQTFADERKLMGDFLKEAGYAVEKFYTDAFALRKFESAIKNSREPVVVVTSQRDMRNRDDIGNKVHGELMRLQVPTLTIVYARAVGDPNFSHHMDLIKPAEGHDVVMVHKSSKGLDSVDPATVRERMAVREHIDQFLGRLEKA